MSIKQLRDDIIRLIESKFNDIELPDDKYVALVNEIDNRIGEFASELKDKILEIVEE